MLFKSLAKYFTCLDLTSLTALAKYSNCFLSAGLPSFSLLISWFKLSIILLPRAISNSVSRDLKGLNTCLNIKGALNMPALIAAPDAKASIKPLSRLISLSSIKASTKFSDACAITSDPPSCIMPPATPLAVTPLT